MSPVSKDKYPDTETIEFTWEQTDPLTFLSDDSHMGKFSCYCVGKQLGEDHCPCMKKFYDAKEAAQQFRDAWDKLRKWNEVN
jgi:hypothetical protein